MEARETAMAAMSSVGLMNLSGDSRTSRMESLPAGSQAAFALLILYPPQPAFLYKRTVSSLDPNGKLHIAKKRKDSSVNTEESNVHCKKYNIRIIVGSFFLDTLYILRYS